MGRNRNKQVFVGELANTHTMVQFKGLVLSLAGAQAGWVQIKEHLLNRTVLNFANGGERSGDRNLLNSDNLRNLDEYGCWCYFGSDLGQPGVGPGKGEPVDPVDFACRTLHHGYDCIVKDIEDEGGWHNHLDVFTSDASLSNAQRLAAGFTTTCIPWEQQYISAYYTDEINDLGIYNACLSLNEPNVFQGRDNLPINGITTSLNSILSPGIGRCATL